MKKALTLMLVLAIACTSVFANGKQESGSMDKEPVVFTLNNGAEPESLDPHLISGVPEHRIYEALFEGLVSYNPEDASPLPGVAESWEASNGGTTYTFKIRDGLVWSDGVKIDAHTVVDSWIRMLDPATGAKYAWFPNMFIKGAAEFNGGEAGADAVQIRALDDLTFQMDLVGPLPYVIGALAHYSFAIVPLHAIEKYGSACTCTAPRSEQQMYRGVRREVSLFRRQRQDCGVAIAMGIDPCQLSWCRTEKKFLDIIYVPRAYKVNALKLIHADEAFYVQRPAYKDKNATYRYLTLPKKIQIIK